MTILGIIGIITAAAGAFATVYKAVAGSKKRKRDRGES